MVRQGLMRVFQDESDFEIVGQAANGREAVDLARQLTPDIIVMDFNMPVMSGLEATGIIRRKMPNIAVIGLSMDVNEEFRQSMIRQGAMDLLYKDGSVEDLIQRIRGHLNKKA
jgi:DNA-binding NarL/FixJ family response regulator